VVIRRLDFNTLPVGISSYNSASCGYSPFELGSSFFFQLLEFRSTLILIPLPFGSSRLASNIAAGGYQTLELVSPWDLIPLLVGISC